MKKLIFPLSLLATLLVSCGAPVSSDEKSSTLPSSSESPSSSVETTSSSTSNSSTSSTSSETSTTPDTSTSSSESSQEKVFEAVTVKTARDYSKLLGTENSDGVATSSKFLSVNVRLFSIFDRVSTSGGYGPQRYSGFASDNTEGINISFGSLIYGKLKDYKGQDTSYYTFEGELTSYKGQLEIYAEKATFIAKPTFTVNYESIQKFAVQEDDIKGIQTDIASLRLNRSGSAIGDLISFEAKYLEKLDNAVLLFTDGANFIRLHGSNKISNSFTLNQSYTVLASLGMFRYVPSLEFVDKTSLTKEIETPLSSKDITASDLYKVSYQKDNEEHSIDYENVFYTSVGFSGYVNRYVKDQKTYFVLDDVKKDQDYSTLEAAMSAKALFINNPSEKGISTETDLANSALYDNYISGEILYISFLPYLLNTTGYWMIWNLPQLG